jgi:hypothetical protein
MAPQLPEEVSTRILPNCFAWRIRGHCDAHLCYLIRRPTRHIENKVEKYFVTLGSIVEGSGIEENLAVDAWVMMMFRALLLGCLPCLRAERESIFRMTIIKL